MSEKPLDNPWYYNNKVAVFPDTTWDLLPIVDCSDNISKKCLDLDLTDCIDNCLNNSDNKCKGGMHLKKGSSDACFNFSGDSFIFPGMQVVNHFVHKDSFRELDDVEASAFLNLKMDKYPPTNTKNVLFRDYLYLKNVETGKYLRSC